MQNKKAKIAMTGGGTAGHVLPHFVLLPFYKNSGWDGFYIGSSGIEKKLVQQENIPFYEIHSGKLRRYFSFKNLSDIFRIFLGFLESLRILFKEKPDVLFSKGGYVSVPPTLAAWCLRIPVLTHESDLSPGLATRIISLFSKTILCTFPETLKHLPQNKAQCVGLPVRESLKDGNREKAYKLCSFSSEDSRPICLVMGGSQGSQHLNGAIEQALTTLLRNFRIIHITGIGNQNPIKENGYFQKEYADEELKDLLAISNFVLCRAGANTIFEMLMLKKPMILVPLVRGSRGDQIQNARVFEKNNWALLLKESELDTNNMIESFETLLKTENSMRKAMADFPAMNPAQKTFEILESLVFQSKPG